jgi:hypothetical protein
MSRSLNILSKVNNFDDVRKILQQLGTQLANVPVFVAVPASAVAPGKYGQMAISSNFLFVHNGTIWKFISLGDAILEEDQTWPV